MGKKKGSMGKKKGGGGNSHQRAVAKTVLPTTVPMSLAVPDAEAGVPPPTDIWLSIFGWRPLFRWDVLGVLAGLFSPAGSAC
jgi:hypothetical protein